METFLILFGCFIFLLIVIINSNTKKNKRRENVGLERAAIKEVEKPLKSLTIKEAEELIERVNKGSSPLPVGYGYLGNSPAQLMRDKLREEQVLAEQLELERQQGCISNEEKEFYIEDELDKLSEIELKKIIKGKAVVTDYFKHRYLDKLKGVKELAQYTINQKTFSVRKDRYSGFANIIAPDLEGVDELQAMMDGRPSASSQVKKIKAMIVDGDLEDKQGIKESRKTPEDKRLLNERTMHLVGSLRDDTLKKFIDYCTHKAINLNIDVASINSTHPLEKGGNGDNKRISEFKSDLLINNGSTRYLYLVKIKSNIDDKNYIQVGTTFEKDLVNLNNDVTEIVEVYRNVTIESNLAIVLQYNLIRKYRPNDYIAENEFNEFERFIGYTEIVPMKHKTQICMDIDNVIHKYEDSCFVFKNLILANN